MSDSSLSSTFPIEIIHEIIRNSDVATLARWCLVSRAFLAFAGLLLHEIVTLARPQDVVPFFERLRRNARAQPSSSTSSLLFPFLSSVKRLEILALPSQKEYRKILLDTLETEALSTDVVLAVSCWGVATSKETVEFWVPALVLCLQPVRYEEMNRRGPKKDIYFAGEVLSLYRNKIAQLQDPPIPTSVFAAACAGIYDRLSDYAMLQMELDDGFFCQDEAISTLLNMLPFPNLRVFLTTIKEEDSIWRCDHSVLEDHAGEWKSFEILGEKTHASLQRLKQSAEKISIVREQCEQLVATLKSVADGAQALVSTLNNLRIAEE